jgi:hypothetical protein
MTRITFPADTLAAHNEGILDYLRGAATEEPEVAPPGTIQRAYRAGWLSARNAMKITSPSEARG